MSGQKAVHKSNPASQNTTKVIKYDGLQLSVPANWPVYWLSQDPHQCIRYDINAVYVGTPGANQNCPAGIIGRADTITIGAPSATKGLSGLSVATGTIVENPSLREFAVAMPASWPWIEATYGTDPALVERTLNTMRVIKSELVSLTRSAQPKISQNLSLVGPVTPWPTDPWPTSTPTPTPIPTPTPTPTPTPAPAAALAGFDTCTAPSLTTMKAWRAKYAATAIYIGGQMMACGYGDLSASWVQQAEAMGWSLMPTYVGLQAPCNSFSGKINPSQAAAQGTAAANQAISNANSFGLGAGSPIYNDMEGYDHTNAGCRTAVLTFLDAWDRQLAAMGYVSGVYSSAGSGAIDLQSTNTIAGHALAEPEALWFALWDNAYNLTGSPYLNSTVWPTTSRSKQLAGNQNVTVGGISLNIDSDLVDSAVAKG